MKILHLAAGNLYGGVERIVAVCAAERHLAPALRPCFATFFDGRLADEIEAAGAECARLGEARASRPQTILRARRRLASLLTAHPQDVVLCHSAWTYGIAAPVLQRHGVAAALWVHDALSGRTWVERWAGLRQPEVIIANSRFTAGSIQNLYPGVTPSVLYAPVAAAAPRPAADRDSLRRSLGVEDAAVRVVLIASRLETWKGHRELIEALAGIAAPWRLWIAGGAQKSGEEAYEQTLRASCATAGLDDRVQFLGNRTDTRALMHAADIYCQPNNAPEPFGIALVEALYAAIPVITTDMGGATEVLTRDCGILVKPGDVTALRETLRQLLMDPARCRTLGAAGPTRAASLCDPAQQLAALASLLQGVAA